MELWGILSGEGRLSWLGTGGASYVTCCADAVGVASTPGGDGTAWIPLLMEWTELCDLVGNSGGDILGAVLWCGGLCT